MSDDPADCIDRAENQKPQEEREKFIAEHHKLMAQGNWYNRDKSILPHTTAVSMFGIVVAAGLPHAFRICAP